MLFPPIGTCQDKEIKPERRHEHTRAPAWFGICDLPVIEYIWPCPNSCTIFAAVLGSDHEEDPEVLRGGDREQGAPPVPHHRYPARRRILQPARPPLHELRTQ
jgi:hypothetical protein